MAKLAGPKPTPKRRLKTPKQRAEEKLDQTRRREAFLAKKLDDAKAALAALETLHRVALRRYEHAKSNPDLNDEDDEALEGLGDGQ